MRPEELETLERYAPELARRARLEELEREAGYRCPAYRDGARLAAQLRELVELVREALE